MSVLQNIILSFFDVLYYGLLSCKLFSIKINRKMFLYIGLISMITGILGYNIDKKYAAFIGLFGLVFLFIIHKRKIVQILFSYIISTVIIISVQVLILSIINISLHNIQINFSFSIINQLITLLFILAIYYKIPLETFMDYIINKNKIFRYLLVNLFILTFILVVYWNINIERFIENIIIISVCTMFIIVINFVVLNNGLKNRLQEEELRIYQRYSPIIEELIDELRSKQHEFDNHLAALNMAITLEGSQKQNHHVLEYSKEINSSNKLADLIKLHNKLIAGFLYSKKTQALESEIEFEIYLRTYAINCPIREFELVEILGILIDNAFETNVKKNKIIVEIQEKGDTSNIQVMNKYPYLPKEEMEEFFKLGKTTKGKTRGYGLHRLREICKKYDAQIIVDNVMIDQDNYVVFKVSFFNT